MFTNKQHRAVLTSLLLLAAPAALLADGDPAAGWLIEIKAIDTGSGGNIAEFAFDDKQSGTSIGVGYAFNKFVAVEAAYADHGDHFATDCPPPRACLIAREDEVDVRTLSVAVVATWPITKVVELYGKFGLAAWDADFTQFPRDETGREFIYGAGVGANLATNWRLSLTYEKVDAFELETLGLGLAYRF